MTENKNDISEGQKTAGWRGSREVWLSAAKRAFVETGLDSVKIRPLAQQLCLSRTSFYWFFKDRDALLGALLEAWEAKNTGAFISACDAYAETICEAILNLIIVFQDQEAFDSQLDFAVRGWAHQSAAVMARVNAADERRLAAICAMFQRFNFSESDADVRARTVYLTQIGYIAMQVKEDPATRLARVPAYVKTFAGKSPGPGELARFYSRLKNAPAQ